MTSADIQLLTAEMTYLRNMLNRQRTSIRAFFDGFQNFQRDSRDFFDNWRSLVPANPPVGPPPVNTSGTGGGGGGTPPTDPDDERGAALRAFLTASTNKLVQSVKQIDDIQARAMATNTTLQKMQIPELGMRMSKLATEILDLREVGFKNLNKSTLSLMSTMKLTGQSTESLKGFLANTSLTLRLNSSQIQDMSKRLTETGLAYGMSQDKVFQAVNKLTKSVETASLLGKGGQTAEALGEVAAMIGDRATEELGVVAEFLTGIGKESQAMIAGIFDIQNQFIDASKEQQVQLTLEAVRSFNSNFRKFTEGFGTGVTGRRAAASFAEQFGGMQTVRAFQAVEAALMDASKATGENNQKLTNLKTFEEKYADVMERAATSLEAIVEKLPGGAIGTAGSIAGMVAPIAGIIGTQVVARAALSRLGVAASTGAIRGAFGGPMGIIIGALTAIGGTLLFSKNILGDIAGSAKNTDSGVNRTNQLLDPNKGSAETRRTMGLLDVLNMMVRQLGPQTDTTNKEALQVQKEMSQRLADINTNIAAKQVTQPVGFGLTR